MPVYAGSLAIVFLTLLMSVIFLRMGRGDFGVSVLPLCVVPLFHLLGYPVSFLFARLGIAFGEGWEIALHLFSLLLSILLYVLLGRTWIHSRKSRAAYYVSAGLFSVLLTVVLLLN